MNLTIQDQADLRMFLIEWDRTQKEAEYAKPLGLHGVFDKQSNMVANKVCAMLLPYILEE